MQAEEFSQIMLDWANVFFRMSMRDMMGFIHQTGISMGQITVLLHLYYKGPSEVLAFAGTMQLSAAGASQMIERMVQQGWVVRQENPADRRVRLVHLTNEGRKLVEESIVARREWLDQLSAALQPEQREQIGVVLTLLTEKTSAME
jgi:DNA-binding MarR family transcriptional regulator